VATTLTSSPGTTPQPNSTYRVLVSRALRDKLRASPPPLKGFLAGAVAVLRVDPVAPTFAFEVKPIGDFYRMVSLPAGHGFLGFTVVPGQRVVLLLDCDWV
jgi:hypothetical protein